MLRALEWVERPREADQAETRVGQRKVARRNSDRAGESANGLAADDGDDIFDGNDIQPVIGIQINRDGVLGVEEHAVVASDGIIDIAIDLSGDGDDASGDGGDFDFVGKVNAALGGLAVFIFADQDAFAHRLDDFEWGQIGTARGGLVAGWWGVSGSFAGIFVWLVRLGHG
jgi:hypothetical protein